MKWKVNLILTDDLMIYETEDFWKVMEYIKAARLIGYKKIKVTGES